MLEDLDLAVESVDQVVDINDLLFCEIGDSELDKSTTY